MIQMASFTKQKQTHGHRKQTCGYQGEMEGEGCIKSLLLALEDGGGLGGRGVHLSPWILRNTPLDTEVNSEHQLRVDRSTSPEEKNI